MKTDPRCLDCFRRQADKAADLATTDPDLQGEIRARAAALIQEAMDLRLSPPENAMALYRLIAELSSNGDPFAELKRQGNDLALALLPELRGMVEAAAEPLNMAVRFALAGNIIDYGAQQDFDLAAALFKCRTQAPAIDDLGLLRQRLPGARRVLFLADNAGEIIFDRLLIERLSKTAAVTVAVKAGPIINDATMADAEACGLGQVARLLDNGAVCPGTVLSLCRPQFVSEFQAADVVISKGQGNFETLSDEGREVFHLLTVKCPVVAGCIREQRGLRAEPALGSTVVLRLGR